MTSLRNSGNIIALVILVNGLHIVKGLSTKLQKRDADVVCRNWFTESEMITADVGEEIWVPRRAKHQTHHANTLPDTAMFV